MIRKNKAKLTHLNIRISLLQTVIFQMKGNFSSALEISEKKQKAMLSTGCWWAVNQFSPSYDQKPKLPKPDKICTTRWHQIPAMTMKMIGAEPDKNWWIKFWLLFLNQIFCIVKLNLPERIFSKNRCGVSVAHCWLLTLSNSQQLQMILLMLDVNDLSWQIILAVTWVQPTGRYINEVSDAKFTQYNHPSSLLDNFFCLKLCRFMSFCVAFAQFFVSE